MTRRLPARGTGAPADSGDRDEALAFVVPEVVGMLKQAKNIIGVELGLMQETQRAGEAADPTGGKIRNLVAALSSLQGTEKEALKDLGSASGLTPKQLRAALKQELAALEAEIGSEDE